MFKLGLRNKSVDPLTPVNNRPPVAMAATEVDVVMTGGKALALHQIGRLEEARSLYLQILQVAPHNFDATHLLGLIALQCGDTVEARRLIGEALQIQPDNAIAINNLGTAHLNAGDAAAAGNQFERATRLRPDFADAWVNLGNSLHQQGLARQAVEALRRAQAIEPGVSNVSNLLGAALLDCGDALAAASCFEAATSSSPNNPEYWANLGHAWLAANEPTQALPAIEQSLCLFVAPHVVSLRGRALAALGRLSEARHTLEQAVAMAPMDAKLLNNLGAFELAQADHAAVKTLETAEQLAPDLQEATINLCRALLQNGRYVEAAECARRLTGAHPDSAVGHGLLGEVLFAEGRLREATAALRDACSLPDSTAEHYHQSANALMASGDAAGATRAYETAIRLDPSHARARWGLAMAALVPMNLDVATLAASRVEFTRRLSVLQSWADDHLELAAEAVGSTQPYYLAYHPMNNRPVLQGYGSLCTRLMSAALPAPPCRDVSSRDRIRIGIVSAQVREHSVWNAITSGWVHNLDPARFEVWIYHLGRVVDAETERARATVSHFVDQPRTVQQWVDAIRLAALDVLIYPEIGMDAMTTKLASLRLAPVQAASWGHPQTTGLDSIDLYLSAEDLESPGADAHYSERLVRLPGLGVATLPLGTMPGVTDLAALGLPENEPLLLCAGMPFKYLPQHDAVWIAIARGMPAGRLVYFDVGPAGMAERLKDRLNGAFSKVGLDFAARVRFVPKLDRAQFFGLMQRATALLDTLDFSGFNTALQAVECGLPVIAYEGEFLRGRLASGILHRMGLDAWIANSDIDFVDKAIRLAGDQTLRHSVSQQILERGSMLFNDLSSVRSLEQLLIEAVKRSRNS